MTTNHQKQVVRFRLNEMPVMSHSAGKYKSGKLWSKWTQIFSDDAGNLYRVFNTRPLRVYDNCIIEGEIHKPGFPYKGQPTTQLKNAQIVTVEPEHIEDTEEVEAEAYGDNIALHRKENPFWWVVEGREDVIEDEVMFITHVSPALTLDQESAWADYYDYEYFTDKTR